MDTTVDAGTSPEVAFVRLRVSIGGKFEQSETGAWKYIAGETFLETVPTTAKYADVMFGLAEKVDGAVSVKYQLPGEDLDPDALITVADDSDVQELYDEYLRALRLPGTPVKTFRLRLFLFPAAEDAYTPEDLAAVARYMGGNSSRGGGGGAVPHGSGASSGRTESLARAFARAAASSLRDAPPGPPSPEGSTSCSESNVAAPSSPVEAELAWEAGFIAGQEAAAAEAELVQSLGGGGKEWQGDDGEWQGTGEEWQLPLNRRMERLARAASDYRLGSANWDAAQHWTLDSAARLGSGQSSRQGAAAREAAVAGAGAAAVATLTVMESETSAEFQSMFESKYERTEAVQKAVLRTSPQDKYRTQSWAVVDDAPGAAPPPPAPSGKAPSEGRASPISLLPSHISAFGEEGLGMQAGSSLHGLAPALGASPSARLPSHISEFGGEDPDINAGEPELMSVVKAALPDEDLETLLADEAAQRAPPDAARLPRSFELLAAAAEGPSPGPSPGLPAEAMELHRSASVEDMLANVQRIDASQVTVLSKLGEGTFGEVSLAECPTYGRVAVKWIKPTKVERHWASFWREAELMSRLNHPNVLRFYGLVVSGPLVVGIMTEYARGGSLSQYLRDARGTTPGYLPLRRRADLALHAVNGMAYLHERKIIHFDVKPDNLLVDGDAASRGAGPLAVKVADFGLSKHCYGTFCSNVHDLRGTLPYMSPEMILDHQHVTEAADVWSLGVVLWEMLTLEPPFQSMQPAQLIGALSLGKLRLPIPAWCEPEWRALMESCWVHDPSQRPSCRQLAMQLERIRDLAPLN